MSSDRFARAREVFLSACEIDPEGRGAFVRERCGDDRELLGEVEELLRFHVEASTGQELGTPLLLSPPPQEVPSAIGCYRLVRKIGEGGMGEVYEAEQTGAIRRRVAIKVIKWGMDTRDVVARFESERQALALMDHACIARVFDAGATERGRPYFAMEFVQGIPITDYCDRRRLDVRARLELFTQVCSGVQHAHQKGIIHRDLKPSNILVAVAEDTPVPKIIDFGIAKATSQRLTERTVFTEFGQWIGTPEYMSPEQTEMVGLDIDTRTDVYSLGVVLYELLAGAQPFAAEELRSSGFDRMRQIIREVDPPRPSTRVAGLGDAAAEVASRRASDARALARSLRGDLDWIVIRAMEKDRTRRYVSPAELAADLVRHLENRPVVAGPPGSLYRIGKFVRRHSLGVTAACLVALTLVTGVMGTSVGMVRARRQAVAAQRVVNVMVDMANDLNPGVLAERASSNADMLDRAVKRTHDELAEEPLVQARMLTILGDAYAQLGQPNRARPLLEESIAIRRRELGEGHPDYALSISFLGDLMVDLGDLEGARGLHQEALRVRRESLGPRHQTVGWSLRSLAVIAREEGRLDEAVSLLEESSRITVDAVGSDSADIAITLHLLAGLAWQRDDPTEAANLYRRSLEIREQRLGSDHPDFGGCLLDYGRLLFFQGEGRTGREHSARALEIFRQVYGPDHRQTILAMGQLSVFEFALGDSAAARALYRRILDSDRVTGARVVDELTAFPEFRAMVDELGPQAGARNP